MAESSRRGAKLYHEPRDGSAPSAVHCINALVQGPLFCEFDLATVAIELDRKQRLDLLREFGLSTYSSDHFRFDSFAIRVFQEALKKWDVRITPLPPQKAREALIDFEQETAFICHRAYEEDWTCVRRVDGEWHEFDSLYPAPEHVPGFYVPAYIDTLEGFGWTVFLVKGKLPGTRSIPATRARGDGGPQPSREDGMKGNRDGECVRRNVNTSRITRKLTRGHVGWA